MDLRSATWTDVADSETDLALVPVGSIEQHGPHAPLGTDVITAEAVAEAGSGAFDGDPLLAPAIPIGVADEHRHFAGTMWVSPDTFRAYVREAAESLTAHGVNRVVFVNGHGGNVAALREVAATLSRQPGTYAVSFTWFEAIREAVEPQMGHGGPLETALLRHLSAEYVREDRMEEARDGAAARWGEWVSHTNLAHDTIEFSENGVVGDPTDGDASLGAELLESSGDALARLLDAVADRDLGN